MTRGKTKRRRTSLERRGAQPRRRLRRALRPTVTGGDAMAGALFVLAIVVALNYGVLLAALRGEVSASSLERLGGSLLLVGSLAAVGMVYLARFQRRLVATRKKLLVFGSCCLVCVVMAKALLLLDGRIASQWRGLVYLTPLSAFSVFFAVVYGQREAIAAAIMQGLLVGVAAELAASPSAEPLPVAVTLLCGALVAVLASRRIRKRTKLLNVGLLVGVAHVAVLLGFELLRGRLQLDQAPAPQFLWGAVNGIGVGVLMTILLPLIEPIFNVATDIRLLELSDQDQPLLRYLVTLAPSTDNHSRRVALLAEAGAEAIGANSLLALVASYYHDVGKMAKPEYFIENHTGGANPHDRLRPSMSALIIGSHVREGVELAREAKLPRAIIDVIEQHHGTFMIEFFYSRYLEEAGDKPLLDASFFRYPGPKPASKETAIVLLADAVEAASRTLAEPLPSRIEALIKRITTARLLDGQLEDCRLTLSELRLIEQSFLRVLCSMYHARIEYPTAGPGRGPRVGSALSVPR